MQSKGCLKRSPLRYQINTGFGDYWLGPELLHELCNIESLNWLSIFFLFFLDVFLHILGFHLAIEPRIFYLNLSKQDGGQRICLKILSVQVLENPQEPHELFSLGPIETQAWPSMLLDIIQEIFEPFFEFFFVLLASVNVEFYILIGEKSPFLLSCFPLHRTHKSHRTKKLHSPSCLWLHCWYLPSLFPKSLCTAAQDRSPRSLWPSAETSTASTSASRGFSGQGCSSPCRKAPSKAFGRRERNSLWSQGKTNYSNSLWKSSGEGLASQWVSLRFPVLLS